MDLTVQTLLVNEACTFLQGNGCAVGGVQTVTSEGHLVTLLDVV